MQWFYDNQLKRYITQLIRIFSGFKYQDIDKKQVEVPVLYGDLTRQVGAILRDNSENKIPSAPRMAIFITGLELDRTRLADSTYVSKTQVREREISPDGTHYQDSPGRNYTVERIMPTPYMLSVSVDIWSTNTDQKLQILEQILMLFNPSLEIQTTDNYLDWASVSVVYLEQITWSSRTIPAGTESDIDVATLAFSLPIYISPPAKVKRMGVITDIIARVSDTPDTPNASEYTDISTGFKIDDDGSIVCEKTVYKDIINEDSTGESDTMSVIKINYKQTSLFISGNTASLFDSNNKKITWESFIRNHTSEYLEGVSQLRLQRYDWPYDIVGTISIIENTNQANIEWDADTYPDDTVLPGPSGESNKISYIIDPKRTNPSSFLPTIGSTRILILDNIGSNNNVDGPIAWMNSDGSDFVAEENDIIEWDGSDWHIIYDASERLAVFSNTIMTTVYVSNLKSGKQYKFTEGEWLLSIDGEYPPGTWRILL